MLRSIGAALICALAIGSSIVQAQEPLPEFFGVYALQDGKLTELSADSSLNDFGPAVRFVFFMRGLTQPVDKIFFLPPDKPKEIASKQFEGWDAFYRQSQEFGAALEMAGNYGVPANAREIPYRVGPYGGNSEMMRVVPAKELLPGFYQLVKGVRFWIRRAEVQGLYDQVAKKPTVGSAGTSTVAQPRSEVSTSSTAAAASPFQAAPLPSAAPLTARSAEVDTLLQQGDRYFRNRDMQQALQPYLQAATIAEGRADILTRIANTQLHMKNFSEAAKIHKAVVESGSPTYFYVTHRHFYGGCQGLLTVSKDKVSFQASSSDDGFSTAPRNLVEVKLVQRTGGRTAEGRPKFEFLSVTWSDDKGKKKTHEFGMTALLRETADKDVTVLAADRADNIKMLAQIMQLLSDYGK